MNENGFTCLGLLNQERTIMQGFVNQADILRYLVDHYTGEANFFERPLQDFDMNNQFLFP